jgi:hypothetical protein
MAQEKYRLVPRDKAGLLIAMMKALAGNAHISFEGKLLQCEFPPELDRSTEETATLRRGTIVPVQDFVVLPLEQETIRPILDTVLPNSRFMNDVIHVQIEKGGALQFGAYDYFHPDCVGCGPDVPQQLLEQLRLGGVLRSYQVQRLGTQAIPALRF